MARWTVLLLLSSPVAWCQPSQPQPWSLSGTVTDSISGKAVVGAVVLWEPSFASYGFRDRPIESDAPSPNAVKITTDASGGFTLSADPTATGVRLFISRDGYRAQDGKNRVALSVKAGAAPLSIKLMPQSLIQGRVIDAAGGPIAGIGVNLVRVEIHNGRRQARQAFDQITNQNGEFRLEDLPPGMFYLRATGRAGGQTYGPVYYPSAATQDDAQLLTATAGKSISADFHLASHASFHVRGIVTNMPLRRNVVVHLLRGDDPLGGSAAVTPGGTFEITGVTPGSYTVQAYTPDVTPLNVGEAAVDVEARDPVPVKLTLSEGEDISGHIEFRGPGTIDQYAVVYATPFHPRHWPGDVKDSVAVMNPKGNFVLKNVQPGKYEISVRGLPDFYLSELHANTVSGPLDILGKGLTVTDNYPPTLAVVMKSGAAEVFGSIDGASSGELFSVALIVMRDGIAIPTVVRAPEGQIRIGGLSPGDYTLLAWPDSHEVEYRNPDVLSELLSRGTQVSLREGARRSVLVPPVR